MLIFNSIILDDNQPSALVPRKKSRPTSTNKQPQERPSTKRKRSTRKRSQPSPTSSLEPNITTSQRLPLVIGSKYLKIENIDLNELLVAPSTWIQKFKNFANLLIL